MAVDSVSVWTPLRPFRWSSVKETLRLAMTTAGRTSPSASSGSNMATSAGGSETSSRNSTSVRPDAGPIQVDSPHALNAQAGAGGALVMQVETMGKGVQVVLVGGVIIAILLGGMGWQGMASERDRALSAEQASFSREANERTRHEQAEAELRALLKETNTEARMAEYYILELDGKLMSGGFIPPSRGYGQWKQERKK